MGMQEKKEGRRVIARTRRAINARFTPKVRPGATARELRDTLECVIPYILEDALRASGLGTLRGKTADDLDRLNHAIRWATAWNRPVEEYYSLARALD